MKFLIVGVGFLLLSACGESVPQGCTSISKNDLGIVSSAKNANGYDPQSAMQCGNLLIITYVDGTTRTIDLGTPQP